MDDFIVDIWVLSDESLSVLNGHSICFVYYNVEGNSPHRK